MGKRGLSLTEALYDYLIQVSLREPEVLARLRRETAALPTASAQIAPEQGQFMALLVELTGTRRILELGTFTGYSALVMARALPAEGRLITCDLDPATTAIARRYWAEAGVAEKIELRLAAALDTLEALLAEGESGRFDLCFIDADKRRIDAYYERALALVRPGGLIAIDNLLWRGAVADPARQERSTRAIRALNEKLREDARISLSLVPIGDGLGLARKR